MQWSGVTQKSGRDKKVEWRGGIALDKGAVLAHTPYALDQYDDAVTRVSNKVLRFATATSGDPDGVLIDLDAPADARLSFFSNVKSFEIPLADISAEPTIIEAGGVNIRVLVAKSARPSRTGARASSSPTRKPPPKPSTPTGCASYKSTAARPGRVRCM